MKSDLGIGPMVVTPPPSSWRDTPGQERGMRHYINAATDLTLCGRDADGWGVDVEGGEATCRACVRIAKRLGTPTEGDS